MWKNKMNYEEHISKSYDQIKAIKVDEELINQLKAIKEDSTNNYPEKNLCDDLLIFAMQKGNLPVAKHCIDLGAEPEVENGILLKKAIKALNYEKVKVLTSHNDIDLSKYYELQDDLVPTKKNETDYKNYPWKQSQKRNSEKSKINEPAKVKGRTLKEKNPMMLNAIEKGELDIILKLKSEGVNMHADNDYYLQFAAKHNNAQLVDYFLKEGCDPSLHNGQALVYAFSKCNFSLFKKLVVNGGLKNKTLEDAFKKELKYHNDLLNNEIAQEHKNIEFNNFLYDLQFNYLTSNQRKSKVEEKPVEVVVLEDIAEKEVASPFGFLMAQPTNMHGDKKKRKTTERVAKPKEQILSPFDKVKIVQEKFANMDIKIQFKEESKAEVEPTNKEVVGKEVVNLEGKTLTRKELQKSWDEGLVLSFAKCESINMRKFTAQFLANHHVTFELLNENNITLKRMPAKIMNNQWDMTPHRFICQHLPQLSELLFKQKMSDIPDNLSFYTQKIKELKINTIGEGVDKKASIVKEKRELRYAEDVFEKTLLAKEINNKSLEVLKRNSSWNKVK
jgi:hypothetical protein